MGDLLSYKNYNGTVEYSEEDNCLFGKVLEINSLLSYEGDSIQELKQAFYNVVDEYLENCSNSEILPEKAYKGSFTPYESSHSIGIDLVALTRYAKSNEKKVKELSMDEVALFRKKKLQ